MNTPILFATAAIYLASCVNTAIAQTVKQGAFNDVLQESFLITGELVDGKSENIIFIKAPEHPFSQQIIVPVIDGKFRLVLPAGPPEAYMAIPEENFENGFMRPFFVFAEENVYVELHPGERYTENTVSGSPLTEAYQKMKADFLQKREERQPEIDSLWKLVEAGQLAEKVVLAKDSILDVEYLNWQADYIKDHPTLVSYLLIKELLVAVDNDYAAEIAKKYYPAFAARFPDHPYTEMIGTYLNGKHQLEQGKRYISFKAEDLQGNVVLADTLLAPKATLLNFWASWCGPCIGKARTMVPVYEAFKDKGFDIINIARELHDTKWLSELLEREKQPWQTNLVDLDSKYGVWNKYGITNIGGMMVLLDGSGKILAVEPTAEEVKELLENME